MLDEDPVPWDRPQLRLARLRVGGRASRERPNLYASIAATINFVVRSPRMFAEIMGKLLFWCGEDKIVYGSEAPIFHPQWALRAFMDFQIPQDLCDGYGYLQLTDVAERKILGGNLPRLHGMDVDDARSRLGRAQR